MFNNNRFRDFSAYRQDTLRLQNHDYSGPGAYHVVTCARGILGRGPLFAHPVLHLMLQTHWYDLVRQFPCLLLDTFVIMPDHLHLLLWPNKWPDRAPEKGSPELGAVIGAFKSTVFHDWLGYVNSFHHNWSAQIWQKNYWERCIRIGEVDNTRRYIHDNPFLEDEIYEEMDWTKPIHQETPVDYKELGKIQVTDVIKSSQTQH